MLESIKRALEWPQRFAVNAYLAFSERYCPLCGSSKHVADFHIDKDPNTLPVKYCSHCNHNWPSTRV